MPTKAAQLTLSPKLQTILERLARSRRSPQWLVERSRMILLSAADIENAEQARQLGVDRQRVRRWRLRWHREEARLAAAERQGGSVEELEHLVMKLLADDARCGAPPKFTPEQVASIIAVACESPADRGIPTSHWTAGDLAAEVVRRGLVPSISVRQVRRFFERSTCVHT